MSLRFRGGDKVQRGRGIGGLLRIASSIFKPLFKTVGSAALKVARSNTGKMVGNALKEQAINSGTNFVVDALRGNDLEDSVHNEVKNMRKRAADTIESARNVPMKKNITYQTKSRKKKKQVTYGNKYSDSKTSDWLAD